VATGTYASRKAKIPRFPVSVDELGLGLDAEFLVLFSHLSFLLAQQIVAQLAKTAVSIVKQIIGTYSAALGAIFFLADLFDESESGSYTEAKVARNETEYASSNSIADLARGRAFEEIVLGVRAIRQGFQAGPRWRIPDYLNEQLRVLIEVKSVKNLTWTQQLDDYFSYMEGIGGKMTIVFDGSRIQTISSTIQQLANDGRILLEAY
jgi:hypothetical protein